MRKLRALFLRLLGFFQKEAGEREFAEEIEAHLQMHIEDNVRSGMNSEEARRSALLRLGSVESTKQAYRERNTLPFFETILQDLRFAVRQLIKNPGLAIIAILVLALGIGTSVAIFGFVDATLIKPLPYQAPSQLANLFESNQTGPRYHLSYLDYLDWKKLNHVFRSMDIYELGDFLLKTPEGTSRVSGVRVSDGFLRTLGVHPIFGRDFYDNEQLRAPSTTVILSYAAWHKRFAGRADALGQKLILNGTPATIIGVLPKDFHFAPAEPADFWLTVDPGADCSKNRACHDFYGVARLNNGSSFAMASAEMKTIAQHLQEKYPNSNRNRGATVMPLNDAIFGDIRPILLVLFAGSGLLLLIASVNVSSLLLVRAENRKREMALRSALGATSGRLIRQFITEGLLLSAGGGVFGATFAALSMRVFLDFIPTERIASMPYLREVGLNPQVFLFGCAISLFTGILFSLIPILRLSLRDIRSGLNEGGRSAAGTLWRRFGTNLVIIELAMAMVLMVGAGLMGKSFYRLLHVDTGLEPDNLALLRVWGQDSSYGKPQQMLALQEQILTRISSLPGVKSVALSRAIPIGDGDGIIQIGFVGSPNLGANNEVNYRPVSTAYFTTLKAQLLHGRYFAETDDSTKPLVAIVNKAFATRFFRNEVHLGKRILDGQISGSTPEIVGIVDDIKEGPLDVTTRPVMYVPFKQNPDNLFYVIARTSQDPQTILSSMAESIHQIDSGIATYEPMTMIDHIHDSPSESLHRCSAWLIGGFAGMALLLGVVGLYGVIAYTVNQRTREIGVRMALGAQRRSVCLMILQEAGLLAVTGIGIGIACALGTTTLLRSLLFQVSAWDISTMAAVATVLATSTLLASYLPARRAASVNPVEALRAE